MDYIDCNLSQVARKFGLKGPALANFMRVHFPQTLVWREEVRRWMGINDNTPRGLLPKYEKQYADAVKLYETSDLSISEIAALCGVSSGGFGQHLRFYPLVCMPPPTASPAPTTPLSTGSLTSRCETSCAKI